MIWDRLNWISGHWVDEDLRAIERLHLTSCPLIDDAIEQRFIETACDMLCRIAEETDCDEYSRVAAKGRTREYHYLEICTYLQHNTCDPRSPIQPEIQWELDRLRSLWGFHDEGIDERSWRYEFAWTPREGSWLGAIMLRRAPSERLTSERYWNALGERISRLIAAETKANAREMLKVVADYDPNVIFTDLRQAGFAIAHSSEELRAKVSFPLGGLAADQIAHNPDLLDGLLDGDDTLEDFLDDLYD